MTKRIEKDLKNASKATITRVSVKETKRLGVIAVAIAAATMITIAPTMFATAEAEVRGRILYSKQNDDSSKKIGGFKVATTSSDAGGSTDKVDLEFIENGDYCGVHDYSSGTSYEIDCETGNQNKPYNNNQPLFFSM